MQSPETALNKISETHIKKRDFMVHFKKKSATMKIKKKKENLCGFFQWSAAVHLWIASNIALS